MVKANEYGCISNFRIYPQRIYALLKNLFASWRCIPLRLGENFFHAKTQSLQSCKDEFICENLGCTQEYCPDIIDISKFYLYNMLSKTEHIDYWLSSSNEDWERSLFLHEKKDYVFCLFCVHLSIEKLSKALWVKENQNNYPPRIHEIKYLLADTSFVPDPEQSLFIDNLQKYQIEGRYPDYKKLIYSYTTLPYTDDLLDSAKKLRKCLQDSI